MQKSALNPHPTVQLVDPVWSQVRLESEELAGREPELSSFVTSTILHHDTLEEAVAHRISARLDHPEMGYAVLMRAFEDLIGDGDGFGLSIRRDITAVAERDPACMRYLEPVLYFKGFHALQTHRLAHYLWGQGRKDFALYLQSRSSAVFQVDIHPAARIGRGVFLDHSTGLVIGGTAVVEDDVSILQGVTLGGTGKERGDRHPKIRRGVLIGAGAKILGNIEIGHCSLIAAGSVVLKSLPPKVTAAGVPARIVGDAPCEQPAQTMDQVLGEGPLYYDPVI
ncbi:serine acetyltransferase [Agaricicola taiwanensis]|uniref:Serine acetyltransferase n=1 Tax=Agaricicola taiwanensis TaxID=591372 RepID=A0A8J2YK52_9RHOB|nr:serine O-acetyltransferase [Agaricicola taiwanensis]GGE47975.1 serine acetyltransferase [Agaricicola taiwanensis]